MYTSKRTLKKKKQRIAEKGARGPCLDCPAYENFSLFREKEIMVVRKMTVSDNRCFPLLTR